MDKETYEKQKAFAGKKVPSMNRRCVGHDYQSRQIYMITMVTEGRRPLFGQVVPYFYLSLQNVLQHLLTV